MRLEKFKIFLNDRLWPVDRLIILYTTHCFVNAWERVKCFLITESPSRVRFISSLNPCQVKPSLTANEYISRLIRFDGSPTSALIYEETLIEIFKHCGIEVRYEPGQKQGVSNKGYDYRNYFHVSSWIVQFA